MSDSVHIAISGPEDGQVLNVLGAPIRVCSPGRNDQLFFADHPVPAGYHVPLHVHHDEDELFYLIAGELTLISETGETIAKAGSFVHLPHGIPHGFANRSGKDAHMLVIAAPGGALEGVFLGLDRAAQARSLTPETIARVLADNRLALV